MCNMLMECTVCTYNICSSVFDEYCMTEFVFKAVLFDFLNQCCKHIDTA